MVFSEICTHCIELAERNDAISEELKLDKIRMSNMLNEISRLALENDYLKRYYAKSDIKEVIMYKCPNCSQLANSLSEIDLEGKKWSCKKCRKEI